MNRQARVIVTKSSCPYVPLNVICIGYISKKTNKLICAHREDTGAGTHLNGNERIEFTEIE